MTTEPSPWKNRKFRLFHRISSMLRDAPNPVRRAWREGWTDIFHSDSGWYGECPIAIPFGNAIVLMTDWKRICGPDGEEPYYEDAPSEDPTTECDFEIEIGTGGFRIG